ncbi:MAG: YchJ family metal-binding protein [Myxococcota bacterium]|nr:YchJ family metal-binding protein [Myxococcota bacterium]
MLCPCCSMMPYAQCCGPLLSGTRRASSALALMRSRYTAFAMRNAQYIYDTYAKEERRRLRLLDISRDLSDTAWVKLEIVSMKQIDANNARVSFRAYHQKDGLQRCLSEDSAFVKEAEGWRYVQSRSKSLS